MTTFILLLLIASSASAVQLQDLVRIKGAESSKLVGMGLVVGLRGTGDGGKYITAMENLATAINRFSNARTSALDLKDTKNVAIVMVEAIVPASGAQEGDKIDVYVSAIGAAKSLAGGRLFMAPLTGPLPGSPVYAFASGGLVIEDEAVPTVGMIRSGAQMSRTITARYMDENTGLMTLVLQGANATWPIASSVANLINGLNDPEGPPIAQAIDQKSVVVRIPDDEQRNPATFIAFLMQAYIDPSQIVTGARVQINKATGTIIISGDVQISPVVISHPGLTLTTITPPPEPTVANPQVTRQPFASLDPEARGVAKLRDLVAAFNQLKVEPKDRIAIIEQIDKMGKLHAKVTYE